VSTCFIQLWLAGAVLGTVVMLLLHPEFWRFVGDYIWWPVSIVLIILWHVASQIALNKYVTDGKSIKWPWVWLFLYVALSAAYCVVRSLFKALAAVKPLCCRRHSRSAVTPKHVYMHSRKLLQGRCAACLRASPFKSAVLHAFTQALHGRCAAGRHIPGIAGVAPAARGNVEQCSSSVQVALLLALHRLVVLILTSILALSRLDSCLYTVMRRRDRGYASFLAMALMLHAFKDCLQRNTIAAGTAEAVRARMPPAPHTVSFRRAQARWRAVAAAATAASASHATSTAVDDGIARGEGVALAERLESA
jgi:hypothetical protein